MKYLILTTLVILSSCSVFKTRAELAQEQAAENGQQSINENVKTNSEEIATLQSHVTELTERLDMMEHKAKQELEHNKKAENSELEDLKVRIAAIEETQKSIFEELKSIKESQISNLQAEAAAPAKTKRLKFSEIESLVNAKKYDQATEALKSFLKDNPKSKHKNEAHYLLGESLYHTGDYPNAIVEFSELSERSADLVLYRKSTLRIAESFKKIGKAKDAKTFAQLLIEKYPNSEEAKKAKKLLK